MSTLAVLLYLPYTGFLLIWYCTRLQTINKETNKYSWSDGHCLHRICRRIIHTSIRTLTHYGKGIAKQPAPKMAGAGRLRWGLQRAGEGTWWRDWVVGREWGEEGEWADGSDWGRRRRDQSVRWEGYRGRTKGRTRSERNGRDWEGNQFESNAHQMARTTQTIATISHYLDSPRYHLFPFTICSNVFSPKEDFCL